MWLTEVERGVLLDRHENDYPELQQHGREQCRRFASERRFVLPQIVLDRGATPELEEDIDRTIQRQWGPELRRMRAELIGGTWDE